MHLSFNQVSKIVFFCNFIPFHDYDHDRTKYEIVSLYQMVYNQLVYWRNSL